MSYCESKWGQCAYHMPNGQCALCNCACIPSSFCPPKITRVWRSVQVCMTVVCYTHRECWPQEDEWRRWVLVPLHHVISAWSANCIPSTYINTTPQSRETCTLQVRESEATQGRSLHILGWGHLLIILLPIAGSALPLTLLVKHENQGCGAGAGAGAAETVCSEPEPEPEPKERLRLRKGIQWWKNNGMLTANQQTAEQTDCLYFSSIFLEQVHYE